MRSVPPLMVDYDPISGRCSTLPMNPTGRSAAGSLAREPGVELGTLNGLHFISGAEAIGNFLSQVHGVGRPH